MKTIANNCFYLWEIQYGKSIRYENTMLNSCLGVATVLYETRLGCLENKIPKMSQEYIAALHLMFSSFKTTMYAGAIPKWLRTIIPKPWEEFCSSWDGLFKFSKSRGNCGGVQCHCENFFFFF